MKPISESRTTADVYVGAASAGCPIVALVLGLRALGILPWDPMLDVPISATLSGLLGPLISRLLAKRRGK